MAKGKRKISAAQRDKVAIETAKILKRKGVLSKSTKLHGGKFVSRAVLKKVQEFQHVAKPTWTTIKVPSWYAAQAKAEGYQVTHGRVVVPKDHDFIKRAKKDIKEHKGPSGVKPVKGGFMSEVQVTFNGANTADLIRWLETNDLDSMKLENEQFAFRFSGPEGSPIGMSYRPFLTTAAIRDYLQYYQPDIDTTGFKFYRLHPEDVRDFIKSPRERGKWKRDNNYGERKGPREKPHGHATRKNRERRERLARNQPAKYAALKEAERERARKRYEAKKSDPAFMEAQRKKALARYHKGKK